MHHILFAASEAHPLIKTGGLGDVCGSLPAALKRLRQDVRLILPAYRQAFDVAQSWSPVAEIPLPGRTEPVRLLEGILPRTSVTCWLVDIPAHFDRTGHPYVGPEGRDWPDNAQRFADFSKVVVQVALDRVGLDWKPHVVHCHDWQTGLVPALLARERIRPATVFTIHNLAYQGLFPRETLHALGLPGDLWSPEALEFYGRVSFIKGGLVFSDVLSTVSPTYAQEVQTPELGCGLEGLLRKRSADLIGILNGVDYQTWNPATDDQISATYDRYHLDAKQKNKRALQDELGLPTHDDAPLLGMIGRLVEQKGFDLFLEALPDLAEDGLQFAILGSGENRFEEDLLAAAATYSGRLTARVGFDESLAHRIEAGADMFLMPSRFEPCGLNQMYSLRYGTVPIVRRTGGLADTVVDCSDDSIAQRGATGIVFDEARADEVRDAVRRAIRIYHRPQVWRQVMRTGMAQDFSWETSAWQHLASYRRALRQRPGAGP